MKQTFIIVSIWLCSMRVLAQNVTPDSIMSQKLNEVVVEAQMQRTDAKKSTYIPTVRQKNASQSGADLLDQMSIPQLKVSLDGNIETNSGKEVAVFIDNIPATENDLKAMRISDVKRVEYYEYPSDPRLQGHQFVVNYVMTKYEYGGYVKAYDHTNLLHFSEQLLGNVRLQYKNMTYDLMGYGWGHSSSHYGSDLTETYRLPQEDGTMKVFDRYSNTLHQKKVGNNTLPPSRQHIILTRFKLPHKLMAA